MINRLGIVIHWIGLILSLCVYLYFWYSIFQHYGVEYTFEYDRPSLFTNAQVTGSFILIFPPLIISWILRYILSGSTIIVPIDDKEIRTGLLYLALSLPSFIFGFYYAWVT